MTTTTTEFVTGHYGIEGMTARLDQALAEGGITTGPVDWSTFAPLDQFHARGLASTKELAEALDPAAGDHILDLGSGLGGPARFLAAVYHCQVTGIELTPVYVEIGRRLTQLTGQSADVAFEEGDATSLPFRDESFDHAWTQHVAMNILDKATLYQGVYRVLKPGGRFAIFDIVEGETKPLVFPLPWATDPAFSFLVTPAELESLLASAGFKIASSIDTTELALPTPAEPNRGPVPQGIAASPLALPKILGPSTMQMLSNIGVNIREGRVRLRQIIAQK